MSSYLQEKILDVFRGAAAMISLGDCPITHFCRYVLLFVQNIIHAGADPGFDEGGLG